LYKFIVDYIKTSINDKKIKELLNIHNDFPIYNDLEPFKIYDFEIVISIHAVLIELLTSLAELYSVKDFELKKYQNKNKFGFDIDNFVNTILFNNTIIREKIQLFINYLSFFHKLQLKYLTRYSRKIELVISQIDVDIDFEENKISSEDINSILEEVDDKMKLNMNSNEIPMYNVEYNSNFFSSEDTVVEVVENSKEVSDSKRKKYLAKKKRIQQQKMEDKKECDDRTDIGVVVYKNDIETEEENIQLMIEEDRDAV
jgi:hypothetical protein